MNAAFTLRGKVKELKPIVLNSVGEDQFDTLSIDRWLKYISFCIVCVLSTVTSVQNWPTNKTLSLTFQLIDNEDESSCVIVDGIQAAVTMQFFEESIDRHAGPATKYSNRCPHHTRYRRMDCRVHQCENGGDIRYTGCSCIQNYGFEKWSVFAVNQSGSRTKSV